MNNYPCNIWKYKTFIIKKFLYNCQFMIYINILILKYKKNHGYNVIRMCQEYFSMPCLDKKKTDG